MNKKMIQLKMILFQKTFQAKMTIVVTNQLIILLKGDISILVFDLFLDLQNILDGITLDIFSISNNKSTITKSFIWVRV
ncbi:hypothetical protein BGL34_04445 [Fructilactobacillus lindneri]|uniref:Uncharacterized protein n=1 Tax=Fructilactobacillus lindneri TaxID=53444 RepID=A0AB33BPT3_9LACO|nr:hypothetical protein AYR60_01855 [Fructilactobacillus lindneri]POH23547.1 hypothetical protein BHU33_04725 [Fructilactobacillus lindneri DSM 20690 = JCM 11027]ANZ58873.1 hypothetical protein AYR59_01855 [Fructilactobacillus lindneri]POG97754.1 hypothetical protein BGL31_06000 [Fructilactobacillus lindneri]POH00020.1 hypothetical protein BGL32_04465 [Fructilactobacillus lindneri]